MFSERWADVSVPCHFRPSRAKASFGVSSSSLAYTVVETRKPSSGAWWLIASIWRVRSFVCVCVSCFQFFEASCPLGCFGRMTMLSFLFTCDVLLFEFTQEPEHLEHAWSLERLHLTFSFYSFLSFTNMIRNPVACWIRNEGWAAGLGPVLIGLV